MPFLIFKLQGLVIIFINGGGFIELPCSIVTCYTVVTKVAWNISYGPYFYLIISCIEVITDMDTPVGTYPAIALWILYKHTVKRGRLKICFTIGILFTGKKIVIKICLI